jgi:hypothetical protein
VNTIINTSLANNGGSTETYSLVYGSVASGSGDSALNPSSVGSYDQRGPDYHRTYEGSMDIGAVEDGHVGNVVSEGANVKVFGDDGALLSTMTPFSGTSVSAVDLAVGNVTGDGPSDIVVASTNGLGEVKIYSGKTGQVVDSYYPYGTTYKSGLNIAIGDVVAGQEDIVVGPGGSGEPVVVLNAATGKVVTSFTPFPQEITGGKYTGGVHVAAGNLTGAKSGQDEVIVGTANPQPAFVEIWSYNGSTMVRSTQHYVFPGNGVFLASGSLTPGGPADIIVGTATQTGSTAKSMLYVISGMGGNMMMQLPMGTLGVFSNASLNEPARVAVRDVNRDGIPDIIVATGAGTTQQIRIFDLSGTKLVLEETLDAQELDLPANYTGGLYVG